VFWWLIAGAVVLIYIVGTRLYDYRRVVAKGVSPEEMAYCLTFDILRGTSGTHLVIYHLKSSTMIEVTKTLTPNYLPTGAVRLRVAKKTVPRPSKWRVDRAKKCGVRGIRVDRVMVWSWDLPSPDEGQTVLEADCGASLAKTLATIEHIISADERLAGGRFYVWGETKTSFHTMGAFEDMGS